MNGNYSKRIYPSNPKKNKGFSLFELVAFIIVSAIIYSVAVNRFSDFPEAAERANFRAVVIQMQTGVSLETMLGLSTGNIRAMQDYVGLNPMDLLLKPPSNYLGAFAEFDENAQRRRSWYFDSRTKELVYLVNAAENVYLIQNSIAIPTAEIRFGIIMTYRDPITLRTVTFDELQALEEERSRGLISEETEGVSSRARSSGVVLRPTVPYRWEESVDFAAEAVNTS
jgi:type II secretory pathway pseudopilin PulG